MFNPNKITKILGATFILVSSNVALAATAAGTATVTVQNTFTLTETTALSFGTIRAKADATGSTNIAALVLDPDGSTTVTAAGDAEITALTPATAGVFTVAGAASFTDLEIEFPADFKLVFASAPPTSPDFEILQADWTADIIGGANDTLAYNSVTPNLQTDNTGAVAFSVGTSLKTDSATSSTGYLDESYTGNYTMTVNY
tara:strand:- start:5681 stop:6283 length:603 start_codon:yes stop_codon:yes gene_type:complete